MTVRRTWLVVISALAILRLYLTGDRDILALNSPHDEQWFIDSVFNRIWGGTYNQMTMIRLPVYSAGSVALAVRSTFDYAEHFD